MLSLAAHKWATIYLINKGFLLFGGIMIPSKEKLYELFVDEEMRQVDIAKLYDVNRWTVRTWLKNYGISVDDRERKVYKNKDWLYQKYWEEELSCQEISEIVSVSSATIQNWMTALSISSRDSGEAAWIARRHKWQPNDTYQNKAWLFKQYIEIGKPSTEIGREQGVTTNTILNWLARFDIDLYPRSEWLEKMWKDGVYDGAFCSPTSIEIEVQKALDSLGIEHQSQYRPDDYTRIYDEFIPPNTFIETHGNYWHSEEHHPGIEQRDAEKRQWAENNGYRLVVFWESEIKEIGAKALIEERVLKQKEPSYF